MTELPGKRSSSEAHSSAPHGTNPQSEEHQSLLSRRRFMGYGIAAGGAAAMSGSTTSPASAAQGAAAGPAHASALSGHARDPTAPVECDDRPVEISGVIPRLTVSGKLEGARSESGIGALMPWNDRLWLVTYVAHLSYSGGGTGLFYITEDFRIHKHPASVVGTYANRFVHDQTRQLIIGPHIIDADNNVRTFDALVNTRLTATAAHLHDPKNKVYFIGMESEVFEADVRSLKVRKLFHLDSILPPKHGGKPHYKGGATAAGRLIVANNAYYEADARGQWSGGVLAQWDGKGDWEIVDRTAYTDIHPRDGGDWAQAWAIGWDASSALLNVLTGGQWRRYRLPKASHAYDGAWLTEWPRIREVESERLLMDLHGMFYELPLPAYGGRTWGVRPVSQHLRIVPDFCSWRGLTVLAGNQVTAVAGNELLVGEPQSNLWLGKTDDLWKFGKPRGWGGPWLDSDVHADQPSDPFLMTGFEHKGVHLAHQSEQPVRFTIQVDFRGDGSWHNYQTIEVGPRGYTHHTFPAGFSAHWVRLVADSPCRATAQFTYT